MSKLSLKFVSKETGCKYKSEIVYRQISFLHDILSKIEGKLKTLADASIVNPTQLKAFKDLLQHSIREEHSEIGKVAQWLAFSLKEVLKEDGAFKDRDFVHYHLPNWNPFDELLPEVPEKGQTNN